MAPIVLDFAGKKKLIAELRSLLQGRVIMPGVPQYDEARSVYSGGFDRRPALIARMANVTDIANTA